MAAEALLEETGDFFSGTGKKKRKAGEGQKKGSRRSIAGGNGRKKRSFRRTIWNW